MQSSNLQYDYDFYLEINLNNIIDSKHQTIQVEENGALIGCDITKGENYEKLKSEEIMEIILKQTGQQDIEQYLDKVSKLHLAIKYNEKQKQFFITDNSTNGYYQEFHETTLEPGQFIRPGFGKYIIVISEVKYIPEENQQSDQMKLVFQVRNLADLSEGVKHKNQEYDFDEDEDQITIGRDKMNDINLQDKFVSKKHATVKMLKDQVNNRYQLVYQDVVNSAGSYLKLMKNEELVTQGQKLQIGINLLTLTLFKRKPYYLPKDKECSLCMDLGVSALLNCGHAFCYKCIESLKKQQGKCPHCRKEILSTMKISAV